MMPEYPIGVDTHSAGALAFAAKQQLERVKTELEMMRKYTLGQSLELPESLKGCGREEIGLSIDAWVSDMYFWENWHKKFDGIANLGRTDQA